MSLLGALITGQSALATTQAAIQVTGNNISNSGNADYTRQTANVSPALDQQISQGVYVGTGVDLTSVQRQIDDALEGRLRSSISDGQAASTTQQWMGQVQSVFNALGTSNLSTSMSSFFNSWSTLANAPQDVGQRQVVIQQGQALAQEFTSQRQQLGALGTSVSAELSSQVQAADNLASQVASLNGQIVIAQGAGGSPNSLLDQRDAVLKQLSNLMNINTVKQPNGVVDVYVGSEPLVNNNSSSGVVIQNQTVNGTTSPTVVFKTTKGTIPLGGGGQIGALSDMQARITGVISQEDSLAHNVIFELNKVYSSGQGLQGFDSVTAANTVADPTKALNNTATGLPFTPNNGSFVVHVTNKATGQTTSTLVPVSLTGAAGDTTLNSLTASLGAISGVTATDAGGLLKVSAASNAVEISFSQDSSGALAALGVNTFYTGKDSSDIAVASNVANNPQLLAAARNGNPADNQTALAIAGLASKPVTALNGSSISDTYQEMIDGVSTQTAEAKTNAEAAKSVQDTLQAQRDSLSGVSLDEEAVNLMKQQQAYQGAARLINIVNQLMNTLVAMVQ